MADVTPERLADCIEVARQEAESFAAHGHGRTRIKADTLAALRELAELRERVRWRPIETAPKDGSHVLLYRPHIWFVGYHSDAGWCINAPGLPLMQPEPTGWMPLPEIGPLPGGEG